MKSLFILMILVIPLIKSAAADRMIGGLGMGSCGTWTKVRHDHLAFAYEQWGLGYLSGVGDVHVAKLDPLQGTDADGVWAWVDNYCQGHPLDKIVWAGEAFVKAHPR